MLELYLGGARSGKSRLAEQRVRAANMQRIYVATATPGDAEMAARINHHQQQRQADDWRTVEAPEDLSAAILQHAAADKAILVDCLTLWLSNWLAKEDDDSWQQVRGRFLHTLQTAPGHIVLVSNEVGQGIVPLGALTRRFVDEAGRLHQDIAAIADRVVFVTAGLEQILKNRA
ncbi:MAG: bifunctional adenosylcobinamide kinase/adenosylcobinamide-phosphate guanylyltransferase [Zhongshania sp.]|uniref:bifunctional adenosylcobinamide kinase/adenosylcobinamide-phosphate guanylyltransferase n=1 Tax=Zhongshania sp. TaxID=1971902 RepID=UPI0026138FD8|nr:bifunctional adenosylcobinamide kinase/adenosylcobinamide-phosphate guanylyltransferase [Zhongshania sp.]MDF1692969.1 bifunctional adenosylcobinamide kinase/adenosylcobinamide-phosphate guanylyltransferase [Zhongshania sp.]